MIDHLDTLRATMTAFGYQPERIDRALRVLTAEPSATEQQAPQVYLAPKTLCRSLDISVTTLWRLNLPFHRVGGRKRYLLDEVLAHMDATRNSRRA
jgi:hypothetical protein